MQFPEWVDKEGERLLRDTERAQRRLAYMINVAATKTFPRVSIREVARHVGVDHSVIASSIRRGSFGHQTARLLEHKFGQHVLRASDLMHPLKADAL